MDKNDRIIVWALIVLAAMFTTIGTKSVSLGLAAASALSLVAALAGEILVAVKANKP
ncbi:MAG: hypothetical protein WCW47_00765 [Candidatus Paceibacterota bacterium]|jgi:hypothetical protein